MRRLALGFACAVFASACATSSPNENGAAATSATATSLTSPTQPTAQQPTTTAVQAPGTREFGFALSPRSYQGTDLPDFLDEIEGNADVLMHAGDWLEIEQINSPFHVMAGLAEQRNLRTLMVLSPNSAGDLLRPMDDQTRDRYLRSLERFLAEVQPTYLGLANEVNMLASANQSEFADVVELWNSAVAIVREFSPTTKVFVTLQYEWLLGHRGGWFGGTEVAPDWTVLDEFASADAIGLTTYPSLVFEDPNDLGPSYYRQIAEHTTLPVFFTEIGWTADTDIDVLPGSESEQVAFIEILEADNTADVLVWSFVHADLIQQTPFAGMGLWSSDGEPRPAWQRWLDMVRSSA